jgi:hypothetical protein
MACALIEFKISYTRNVYEAFETYNQDNIEMTRFENGGCADEEGMTRVVN